MTLCSDDASVAVLETHETEDPFPCNLKTQAQLHYHARETAKNREHRGIHPSVTITHHQETIAQLTSDAVKCLPKNERGERRIPDFVSVTRGPGLKGCLQVGINVAQGLAAGWQIPLLGIHHMQAHTLTPRLASALKTPISPSPGSPQSLEFPFLTLLVSGGHTMLLLSRSITDHEILVDTCDVAIGDYLDKVGRDLIPHEILRNLRSDTLVYGRLLSEFAFPLTRINLEDGTISHPYDYEPPRTKGEYLQPRQIKPWGWAVPIPFAKSVPNPKVFSFAGIGTYIDRLIKDLSQSEQGFGYSERQGLARETMRVAFEHIAARIGEAIIELRYGGSSQPSGKKVRSSATGESAPSHPDADTERGSSEAEDSVLASRHNPQDPSARHTVNTHDRREQQRAIIYKNKKVWFPEKGHTPLVISGGVASNPFLRELIPRFLAARKPRLPRVKLICPPADLCTDNAAMIAWCGVEMWRAGWEGDLNIKATPRWPLDEGVAGGGVLGLGGWHRRRDRILQEEGMAHLGDEFNAGPDRRYFGGAV